MTIGLWVCCIVTITVTIAYISRSSLLGCIVLDVGDKRLGAIVTATKVSELIS